MISAGPAGETWIDYDYAIVRLVPYVHLESFLNIGIVIHSRTANYLAARFVDDMSRVAAFAPAIDIRILQRYLEAYCRVCKGGPDAAPIGLLPASERFHWLTAPRSAVMQTSPVHPGRCRELDGELERVFKMALGLRL
jgi:Protein of unknown function (DUF3037)